METGLNASVCVGKQPIMVATASTEHHIDCKQQPIGCSIEAVATMIGCLRFHPNATHATHATQAIAFGWKLGFRLYGRPNGSIVTYNATLIIGFVMGLTII